MKNVITISGPVLISSVMLISCGFGSIENNSWSGEDEIAGVEFSYSLETKSDNTYTLVGYAGGFSVNESGSFKKINNNEIILTSGEFDGSRFVKDGASLKWYLDNGDFFMSLN
jgi:hypothetical protein